jgi:glycosyltransferase involved in cell wall biosynthesis
MNGEPRQISENTKVFKYRPENFQTRLVAFRNSEFWREIKFLSKTSRLSFNTFKTAWQSLSKAIAIKQTIEDVIEFNSTEKYIFYSYWLDEKALALGLLKKQFPDLICISRAHGWDVYEERQMQAYLPYRKFILTSLSKTYPISESGEEYLVGKYDLSERISISRLGTLKIDNQYETSSANEINILSVSMVISLKRLDKILSVVSRIQNVRLKWTHIGDGPLFDSIHKKAKEKENLNPNFSFIFLGQKSNTEVREFLSKKHIDLFINLSETEGIPVSIMEAQSAGIPILATAVGGTPEIVNDENGILVDKDEKDEIIAQKIIAYFNLPEEEKQKKRERSYQNWKENYNAKKNYTNFISTILDLKP